MKSTLSLFCILTTLCFFGMSQPATAARLKLPVQLTCTLEGTDILTSYNAMVNALGEQLGDDAAYAVCENYDALFTELTTSIEAQQAAANKQAGAVVAAGSNAAAGAVGAVVSAVIGAGGSSGGGGAPDSGSMAPMAFSNENNSSLTMEKGSQAIDQAMHAIDKSSRLPHLNKSAWVRGLGGLVRNRSTAADPSSKAHFDGIMGGLDVYSNHMLRIGAIGAMADIHADVNSSDASVDVTLIKAGVNTTLETGPWYFDGLLLYGPEHMESRRFAKNVVTPSKYLEGENVWMAAEYTNYRLTSAFETGIRTVWGPIVFQPFVGIQMDWVNQAEVTEVGHEAAAITTQASNHFSGHTKAGVIFSGAFFVGDIGVSPSIGLSWQHRFGDLAETLNMSFDRGAHFEGAGSEPLHDLYNINAGLNVSLTPNAIITMGYAGSFNRIEMVHVGTAGLKLQF